MRDVDKIIEALKTIQEECSNNGRCNSCPMVSETGQCGVMGKHPVDWKIIEPKIIVRVME